MLVFLDTAIAPENLNHEFRAKIDVDEISKIDIDRESKIWKFRFHHEVTTGRMEPKNS